MRILLALDGSPSAATALELVRNLPWPAPTHIDAVHVIEPVFDLFVMPAVEFQGSMENALGAAEARTELEAQTEGMASPSISVEPHVIVGRAGTVLVETAERLGADLIVMGHRGRGPIASMLLGSVSAEVADHAPCPVLVARTPTCTRAIVALDGTPFADRIVDAVAEFTFLRGCHVDVVSIAPSAVPGPGVILSGAYGMPIAWYEDAVQVARDELEGAAAAAATRLRNSGLDCDWHVHEGDPAATLIDVARRGETDLIIVGTHGRTGMTRLLLGSVARNVLLHAHASVLVLRQPPEPAADVIEADGSGG